MENMRKGVEEGRLWGTVAVPTWWDDTDECGDDWRRWMNSLTCYFTDTPLWLLLKTFPTPPPNFLFSFSATKFSQCFFRQDRGGGGCVCVCVCVLFKEFLLGMRGMLHHRFSIFSPDSNVVLWWQVFLKCIPNQIFWMTAWQWCSWFDRITVLGSRQDTEGSCRGTVFQ